MYRNKITANRKTVLSSNRNLVCYTLGNHNDQKPVLLYVHGGPGYGCSRQTAESLAAAVPQLMEHYTMVFYDQRCSGESFVLKDLFQKLTVEMHIQDAKAVLDFVLSKYSVGKLTVCGHSWGTHLGLKLAQRYPEHIQAYIGIGQVVSGLAGETLSYRMALRYGRRKFPKQTDTLKAMGPPPHTAENRISYLQCHRKIIAAVGGFQRSVEPPKKGVTSFQNRLLALLQAVRIQVAMRRSVLQLWDECLSVDFSNTRNYPFPVFFICGKYDFITPTKLVIQNYRKITSAADLRIFDKTAHRPHLEDLPRFYRFLMEKRALLLPA